MRSPRLSAVALKLSGALTRSRGYEVLDSSEAVHRRADRRHRTRARVRTACAGGRQAGRDRQQAAPSRARRRALQLAAPRKHAVALRGRRRRRRPRDPRDARVVRGRTHREGARHRERHHELHPERDGAHGRVVRGGARPRAGAGLRRGGPHGGRERQGRRGEDGDPGAASVPRLGHARRRPVRGHRGDHPGRPRLREGVPAWC